MDEAVKRIEALCQKRNLIVKESFAGGTMRLDSYAEAQAEKAERNRKAGALRDSSDYEASVLGLIRELLGEEYAFRYARALKQKVICTSDHLGGFYCSQVFQANLLFALVLEKMGFVNPDVLVLSCGQAELENETYARGICSYSSPDQKHFLPIFPARFSVQMASHAGAVNEEMIARFRKRFVNNSQDTASGKTLDLIMRDLYEKEDILQAKSFSDQCVLIGTRLMDHLSAGTQPSFVYLEMERVVQPLLLAELDDETSLLYRIMYDRKVRERMLGIRMPDGSVLGDHLFRAADEKGRKVRLRLGEDGRLYGRNWLKEEVVYETEPRVLNALIQEKRVIPGIFAEALLLFFERGITWMGGMFQASYLPVWQTALCRLLEETGDTAAGEVIRAYDCTGYICGPMLALYGGHGFAAPAGPAELWGHLSFETIRDLAKKTTLWDGHRIGLSEMYCDLTAGSEREAGWYRKIAEQLYRDYPDNIVVHG